MNDVEKERISRSILENIQDLPKERQRRELDLLEEETRRCMTNLRLFRVVCRKILQDTPRVDGKFCEPCQSSLLGLPVDKVERGLDYDETLERQEMIYRAIQEIRNKIFKKKIPSQSAA